MGHPAGEMQQVGKVRLAPGGRGDLIKTEMSIPGFPRANGIGEQSFCLGDFYISHRMAYQPEEFYRFLIDESYVEDFRSFLIPHDERMLVWPFLAKIVVRVDRKLVVLDCGDDAAVSTIKFAANGDLSGYLIHCEDLVIANFYDLLGETSCPNLRSTPQAPALPIWESCDYL